MQHYSDTEPSSQAALLGTHTTPTPAEVAEARRWWASIPLSGGERTSAGLHLHNLTRELSSLASPDMWVTHVFRALCKRSEPHLRGVANACLTDAAGATCYGKVMLHWCQVPFAEQQVLRYQRGIDQFSYALGGVEGTGGLPPTPKQVAYVRALGWCGEVPATRREVGRLIDKLLRQ